MPYYKIKPIKDLANNIHYYNVFKSETRKYKILQWILGDKVTFLCSFLSYDDAVKYLTNNKT
jgi:hypothetical protein